jgi:hypothetical protein
LWVKSWGFNKEHWIKSKHAEVFEPKKVLNI